jgi:hypothetical protein
VLWSCVLLGSVAVTLVLPSASSSAPAPPPPVLARSIYVVRPDPRLCPSPLCGGYWVSRANHSRARCHDGLFRPRCYVATALSELTRQPLTTDLPADSLVRAVLGSSTFPGFGELGAITVTEIWKPLGHTQLTGDFFRIRDIGVRCIRAPCFSLRAWRLNRPFRITVSGLDLSPAKLASEELAQAEAALATLDGLVAAGRIVPTADGGRVFRASRVYFRVARPRA